MNSIPVAHKVIVTADDYGAMFCIDQGILEAVNSGVVSCISVMSNFNRFDLAMKDLTNMLDQLDKKVGVGLHINLTAGNALSGKNSITENDGAFFSTAKLLRRIDAINFTDVENEIALQLKRLREYFPKIDHLSHHVNVMCLHPKLFQLLINMAKKHNLPIRNPHSMSFEKHFSVDFPPIKRMIAKRILQSIPTILKKPSLLPTLSRMSNTKNLLNKIEANGIKTTTQFCDLFFGQPNIQLLQNAFSHFQPNQQTEIMTHPGYYNRTEMIPNGIDPSYLSVREQELSTLTDPKIHALFNEKYVLTAGFSAL